MKQKYTITIADVQMNIITDEAPEAVETVVGILDRKMREISLKSGNRCPKNEAALLCALDYCAERTKLQEIVNKLEAERAGTDIDSLNAEMTKRGEELEEIIAKLTYSEAQREALQTELESVNARLRDALASSDGTAAEKAELDSRVASLVEQLREATEVAAADKKARAAAEYALAEKEADFNETVEKLQALVDDKTAQLRELGNHQETTSQSLSKTQTELDSIRARTDREIADKDARIRTLTAELETAKSTVERERTARNAERMASGTREDTLRMQLAEVTAKLREFRDDYDSLESDMAKKQEELASLAEKETALRETAERELAEKVAELEGASAQSVEVIASLEEKLAEALAAKEEAEVAIAAAAASLTDLQEKEATAATQAEALRIELETVRATIEQSEKEWNDRYTELAEKQTTTDEIARHETALREAAERHLAEKEQEVTAAQGEANALRIQLADVENEIAVREEAVRAELADTVAGLEESLKDATAKLDQAATEKEQMAAELVAAQTQYNEATAQMSEFEAQVQTLKAEQQQLCEDSANALADAEGREKALREALEAKENGEAELRAEIERATAEKSAALADAAAREQALQAELDAVKKEKEDAMYDVSDKELAIREMNIRENALLAEVEKEKALREVYERKLEAKERTIRELQAKKGETVEAPKTPVTELADTTDDSFAIAMKPLRRPVDENQITIDSAEQPTAPVEEVKPLTASDDKTVENEKKKAQKRVRSMFDLITFDNV